MTGKYLIFEVYEILVINIICIRPPNSGIVGLYYSYDLVRMIHVETFEFISYTMNLYKSESKKINIS